MLIDEFICTVDRRTAGPVRKSIMANGEWWHKFASWALNRPDVVTCHKSRALHLWRDDYGLFYGTFYGRPATMLTGRDVLEVFESAPGNGQRWFDTGAQMVHAMGYVMGITLAGSVPLHEALRVLETMRQRAPDQVDLWKRWYVEHTKRGALAAIEWECE